MRSRALLIGMTILMALPVAAQDTFVPSRYRKAIELAHEADREDHVLTVRKLTAAVENVNKGTTTVTGITQVLDCKTGRLVSQTRCNPCDEQTSSWAKRPVGVWFTEASWPDGSTVARAKALILMHHFNRYFHLERMDGTEKNGITYQFWKFDGRRGVPLPDPDADVKPAKTEAPQYGPVQQIEIFYGDSKPDVITTEEGQSSVKLKAVAYASPKGSTLLSPVGQFFPLWSTSCGTLSDKKAKAVTFTLDDDSNSCKVFLYEGLTGKHDVVTVKRGAVPRPPVRVAITFEGGREADGVVLTGSDQTVDLEAHAFRPDGSEIAGWEPEWSVDGGKVEFLVPGSKRKLRVHPNPGVKQVEVHARDEKTGAEDSFLIKLGDQGG